MSYPRLSREMLDHLFTELFYTLPKSSLSSDEKKSDNKNIVNNDNNESNNIDNKVEDKNSFPTDPEQLKAFFESQAGIEYKNSLKETANNIATWAKSHGLDTKSLIKFRDEYFDYSGSSAETNQVYFPLYQQGIPALIEIYKLLDGPTPTPIKTETLSNLFKDMDVCGPACYRHIASAKINLEASSDLKTAMIVFRKKIAEQIATEIVDNFDIPEGMPIHYVTAVLNYYSEELAIPMLEDKYIEKCQPELLEILFENFHKAIRSQMTLEAVVSHIMANFDINNLSEQLSKHGGIHWFENELNFYGIDKDFCPKANSISDYDVEDDTLKIKYDAYYRMYLSVFKRLQQNNLIKTKDDIFTEVNIDETTTLYYLKNRSLKLAYVQTTSGCLPFLSYCIEILLADSHQKIGLEYMKSILTQDQAFEFVEMIAHYIKCFEFETLSDRQQSTETLIQVIPHILPIKNKWFDILKLFNPESGGDVFFRLLANHFGSHLADLIDQPEQLKLVFKYFHLLSDIEQSQFIKQIQTKTFAKGIRPVMVAMECGAEKALDLLGDLDPHMQDDNGNNLMMYAVKGSFIKGIKNLLPFLSFSYVNRVDFTPLMLAAKKGDNVAVKILIEPLTSGLISKFNGKATLDRTNVLDKHSALSYAAKLGHHEVVDTLLAAGASYNNSHGRERLVPAVFAVKYNRLETLRVFAKHKAILEGYNALLYAIEVGSLEMVNILLESKSPTNDDDILNVSEIPLSNAAKIGRADIMDVLLHVGYARKDEIDRFGNTALLYAAQRGHLKAVETLLAVHANPNIVNKYDQSPIFKAALNGYQDIVKVLSKNGALFDYLMNKRTTPLIELIKTSGDRHEIIDTLLSKIANPEFAPKNSPTPLFHAIAGEKLNIVRSLVKHGAHLNEPIRIKRSKFLRLAKTAEQCSALETFCGDKTYVTCSPLQTAILLGNNEVIQYVSTNLLDFDMKLVWKAVLDRQNFAILDTIIPHLLFRAKSFPGMNNDVTRDGALKSLQVIYTDSSNQTTLEKKQNVAKLFMLIDALATRVTEVVNKNVNDSQLKLKSIPEIKLAIQDAYVEYVKNPEDNTILDRLTKRINIISAECKLGHAKSLSFRMFGSDHKFAKKLDKIVTPILSMKCLA